jgi:Flp pilus assembly protein TadD
MIQKLALAAVLVARAALVSGGQPSDIEALYRAGVEALEQDRPFEAIEILNRVASLNPSFRDVQLLLGQSCYLAGLTRPAKQHLEQALEMNPRHPQAALLLGLLLHEDERHVEAVAALERAHDLNPRSPYASIYRGLSLLKLGRARESRADIEEAMNLAPHIPEARLALAQLELAEGDFGKAETLLREILAQAPGNVEAKTLLGRTLFESARPAAAVPLLRDVLEASPHDTEVLYLLAQALLRSGDAREGQATLARFQTQRAMDEESRVLEAAVNADKDDTSSRIRLARLLLDQGHASRALPHVAVLFALLPSDPRVLELAKELERQGDTIR